MKLICKADGAPVPTLSWKNPRGQVMKRVKNLKNTVFLLMTSDQEFGYYTCEATNDVNTDTRRVLVQQISKWNICCSLIVNIDHMHTRAMKNIIPLLFFCLSSG